LARDVAVATNERFLWKSHASRSSFLLFFFKRWTEKKKTKEDRGGLGPQACDFLHKKPTFQEKTATRLKRTERKGALASDSFLPFPFCSLARGYCLFLKGCAELFVSTVSYQKPILQKATHGNETKVLPVQLRGPTGPTLDFFGCVNGWPLWRLHT
jgi:hypothetical protein